jgi:integrase
MIFKRGTSGIYWYEFVYGSKRIRRSTKQRNAQVARQIEGAKRVEMAKAEGGVAPEEESEKETPTFLAFAEMSFLPHVRTKFRAKPKTQEYYENGVKQLLRYGGISGVQLDRITQEHIDRHVERRLSQGLAIGSVNRELQVLRRMFKLATKWKKVVKPLISVELVSGENHRERVISREEEARYLLAAPPLLQDVATVLFDSALRPEECFRLKWGNIRDGAFYINFGKTDAARRRIPMTARVAEVLDRRRGEIESEWVFPAATRSGHIEGSSLKKQQQRVFRVTGIEPFVLYTMRHTCLTRWAPHMDAYTLAYLAGHSDMSVTKRYIHPEDETVKEAFRRAGKLSELPGTRAKSAPRAETAAMQGSKKPL